MTSFSSYKPFLIGKGKSETGLFQYYESWIAPEDAYVDVQDAYVNRGEIWKRDGQTLLGNLTYCNSQILAYGDGGKNYMGTPSTNTPTGIHLPIIAGTVTVRTRLTGLPGITETYTDNGIGVLTGNMGGTGTIDYLTGDWSITSDSNVTTGRPIMIDYSFVNKTASNTNVNEYFLELADGSGGPFSGIITDNLPITPGTVYLAFDKSGTGYTAYFDDGAGNFRTLPNGGGVAVPGSSIVYNTGAWSLTVNGGGTAVNNSPISIGYAGSTSSLTIMGINQWENEADGTFRLTVEDERRLSVLNSSGTAFQAICDVNETLFVIPKDSGGGATLNYTNFNSASATLGATFPTFSNIAPLSITVSLVDNTTGVVQETQNDNGIGSLTAGTIFAAGTIDYPTGEFTINLNNMTFKKGWAINVTFTLQNDYFTGNQSNFFNWTNWDKQTNLVPISTNPPQFQFGFLYLTNNVDPVTLFNGTYLSRPAFAINQSVLGLGRNQILRALDVKVFGDRLLFFRPTTSIGNGNPEGQEIFFSALLQPTNTVQDIPGSGGFSSLSTSGWIQSASFLKDFLIVHCQRDTFIYKNTGSAFAPFQFFKLNSTKTCDAPYASIEFDDIVTSMGTKGLCSTDGQALDRYDKKIFDQYQAINQDEFQQCYGARFDVLSQSWMLYPSMRNNSATSDQVLVWNYLEDSWSVYNMALSVIYATSLDESKDFTWADFAIGTEAWPEGLTWENADITWDNYLLQKKSLIMLGGDFLGNILILNKGPDDNGAKIKMNVTSKKYNPFIGEMGISATFGYLDVYYTVNAAVVLTYQFFFSNSTTNDSPLYTKTVTLDGPPNSDFAWKRIYLNVQAQFIRWTITDNGETGFKILGHLLWASPAGRLTP